MSREIKAARLDNGLSLPYVEQGDPSGTPVVFVHALADSTVSDHASPEFLDEMVSESLKVPAEVWRQTVEGLIAADPAAETGNVSAPTLILWGDRDEFVARRDQERLAAAIPGSRLSIYRGTGHVVHWEEPERVAADIAAFAMTVQARPG